MTDSASIQFTVNGSLCRSVRTGGTRLSDVLRSEHGVQDVKIGCNAGDCGACTVLLDGEPVCACLTPLSQVEGRQVDTLAGLSATDPVMQALQQRFAERGAAQCGICTPGMLVTATALLRSNKTPSPREAEDALGGVLCRCTGYRSIIDAVCNDAPTSAPESTLTACSVGQPIRRLDADPKLTGSECFGDDVAPEDALALRVVRSPHHRARFTFGDLAAWCKSEGLVAVYTAADVPGINCFGVIPEFADQPVFAETEARFCGEAVAAVVGTASRLDSLDLDGFPVTWEPREPVLGVVSARADGAVCVHEDRPGNLMCGGHVQRGNAAAAVATAAHVARVSVTTPFIEHAYIEPEAGFARRVGDRIEVHGCTQAPYMNRDSLAAILGIGVEAVRVVPTATGGGFGSKLDLSYHPYVALAAWHLSTSVRITYTRRESMQSTTKRHPSKLQVAVACDETGMLSGMEFDGDFDTGAYASWGPTVANRVPVHASGPYQMPHYRANANGLHTHAAPAGAFRGFGVPQSAIAQETAFDELAQAVGTDRLRFRQMNALRNGVPTVTGQVFASGVGIGACFDALQDAWRAGLDRRDAFNGSSDGARRYGIGVAGGWYGCGNTSMANPSTIRAGIRADGSVCLHQGAVDIGQGSNTVISQIFADAFGIPLSAITRIGADTDLTPDAGKTSASRQTVVSGNAALRCGKALRAEVLRLSNARQDAEIHVANGEILITQDGIEQRISLVSLPEVSMGYVLMAEESYDPPTQPLDANGQGVPYAFYGYAAQMVELIVDTGLGRVELVRFSAAHDVGKAINPTLVEGQIAGGIAQGIGLALMENFIPGRTDNLHDYLIPTIGDVPPIEMLLIEETDPEGPFGAKGLGEHVLIPTAPAIINAIHDACGVWVRDLPATPDKVLSQLAAKIPVDHV